MASSFFANGIQNIADGTIDLKNSTIKAVLINSTGNAGIEFGTHDFLNDIVAGWRADTQKVVVSTGFSIVGGSDHVNFGSGSQVLNFSTVTTGQKAKGIVIFVSDAGATDTLSQLICYCSFTSAVSTDGTDVDVTLNASGFGRASY